MAGNGVEKGRGVDEKLEANDMNDEANGLRRGSTPEAAAYAVPTSAAKTLRCSLCSCYLSVSPVYVISEDGARYKCGRCTVRTPIKVRAFAYETLARGTAFPCSHEGCDERLAWDDVSHHERDCSHRRVPCICCDEPILLARLVEHLEESHNGKHLQRGGGTFAVFESHLSYGMRVLESDGDLYAVIYDYDDERFGVEIAAYRNCADKQYTLRFSCPDSKYSISIAEQDIIIFEERLHCLKCLKGLCKRESHVFSSYRKGIFKRIHTKLVNLPYILRKTFGSKTIACSIDVTDAVEDSYLDDLMQGREMIIDEEDDDEPKEKFDNGKVLEELLRCTTCSGAMVPPMHECVTGHTMCGECKSKCDKCTVCGGAIEDTRNYALEELAVSLKLSHDESKLTDYAASSLENEITCLMLKCFEKFKLSTIGQHFKACHPTNYHSSKFSIRNVYAYSNVDVLVKNDKTYIVLFDFDDAYFGISMCSLEKDDCNRYEVKLSSSDEKYSVQAVRQKIVPFNEKEHCFKCSLGTCKGLDHTYRKKRAEVVRRLTTKIDRESVRHIIPTYKMNYTVRVRAGGGPPGAARRARLLAGAFRCSACEAAVSPPIRQCLGGHTVCAGHGGPGARCPGCEAPIADTRNVALERVYDDVELSCRFKGGACGFRGGVKRVAEHEAQCPVKMKKR